MYYKLPVKERMDLMRSYKKTNKDMSYSDMVNDYNTSYQRFENGGKVEFNSGGETHVVYKKESPNGNGKGVKGHIMVNHPTKDKGKWDTIDLTAITNYDVKTVQEGITSTKQWHKENPEYAYGGMYQFDNGGKMPKKEINLNIKNQEFNSPVSTWNENLDWQGEKYNDVGLNFNKNNLNIGIGNYVPRSTFEKTGNINPYLNVNYDLNDKNSIGGNFSKDYNGVSFIRKFDNGGKKDNTNVIINNGLPVKSLETLKQEHLKEVVDKNKKNIYFNSLRKELDSIQNQTLKTSNIFDQMKMRNRASDIFKELGQNKPELVKKEINTSENAGKVIIASSKYIFPVTRPLVNVIEGALAVKDMYNKPNTHNTASLMTEVAPYINNKYGTAYQLMGDYLTGQEVGLFPKDKK